MTNIFKTKDSDMPAQQPVKVAQSVEEVRQLHMPASMGSDTRSIQHVERARRGHDM